jgi:hypothetical protein
MKKLNAWFLMILLLGLLLNCKNGNDEDLIIEDKIEKEVEKADVIPLLPHEGIPSPFNLFTVIDDDVERKDFNTVSKWYEEQPNKQIFKLFVGDEFNGERKHARTEAGQGLKWKEGEGWHTFEATMQPSTTLNETYTIGQLFAGCCGPQLRIAVKSNGHVAVESRNNDNVTLTPNLGFVNGTNSFKIKIRSDGKNMEVYFNDELKFSALTDESRNNNTAALYHFRWGVYSNEKMKENLINTVTNITRN